MTLGGQAITRDNFGKLLEPGLRKIVFNEFNRLPWQYTGVFNVMNSKKAQETDLRMGGFSLWGKKGTLENTVYEDPTGTDKVTYSHETFSKGFLVEKEMVDDEQYNQINKMAGALGVAANQTIETHAASVFNNAWNPNVASYKGEALISANHQRLDGGTRSNYIGNLALNEANLAIAHKLASEQVDERGLKIAMNYNTLVTGRANEILARKLLESTNVPTAGSTGQTFAVNDKNVIKGAYKLVILDWLDDPTAWFLMDSSKHELNWFWREKLNFKNERDFDSDVAKYKGRMRFSYGWTSDIGILGAHVTTP